MPSAPALVPLPMDDTTPPVTKMYLVSLIYTPEEKPTPLSLLPIGKGEESPVGRGIIASRKPLRRHTCIDLYHTTSGAKMKQETTPHGWIQPRSEQLLRLLGRVLAQPQRDVLRLHRLPHDRYQLRIQSVQIRLVPQFAGERFEGLPGVVLAAVEAAVY